MELSWAKIVVYVLTLIGYAYTGWGSGLVNNIREAVISADALLGGMFNNICDVVNDINKFKDVFKSGTNDECHFRCPDKDVTPSPNRNHKPSSNGCGAIGMKINTQEMLIPGMTKCCDAHDICYDVCGNSKMECDGKFRQCLNVKCDSVSKSLGSQPGSVCNQLAQLLTDGLSSVGCKSYLDAQSRACYCAPASRESKKGKKFTKGADL